MGCKQLHLPDYFQVVNHHEVHEVHEAGFITGGNPILATNNTNGTNLLFNDMQGTAIGTLQVDK